jgi:hypothetical protein
MQNRLVHILMGSDREDGDLGDLTVRRFWTGSRTEGRARSKRLGRATPNAVRRAEVVDLPGRGR